MVALLEPHAGAPMRDWAVLPYPLATNGWHAYHLADNVNAWIAGTPFEPEFVLINIGVNDMASSTPQAEWEADLAFTLDRIHAAWPDCQILVAYPWTRLYAGKPDIWAGYIDNVLATRGPWAAIGIDERVVLKGGDNGYTNTTDGTHYSAAGQTAIAAAWLAAMGY